MSLNNLILLAIWARVINNLVQSVAHLITYVMLRRTHSNDRFSLALRQRELALSGKNMTAVGWDLLIAVAITWYAQPEGSDAFYGARFLPPIATLTVISAVFATVFTLRFLIAYQGENWGMREREETKVEQAATRTIQAATEIRQTAEDLRQRVVAVEQDIRDSGQDDREEGLDERADEADKRGQRQDVRDRDQRKESIRLDEIRLNRDVADVILKTADDVEDVKQDVHAVKKKIVEEEAP